MNTKAKKIGTAGENEGSRAGAVKGEKGVGEQLQMGEV